MKYEENINDVPFILCDTSGHGANYQQSDVQTNDESSDTYKETMEVCRAMSCAKPYYLTIND